MEKLQFQLPKREKLQFFLLFVALSFTFWTITKFSNTYQLQRTFQISFSDVPDHSPMRPSSFALPPYGKGRHGA